MGSGTEESGSGVPDKGPGTLCSLFFDFLDDLFLPGMIGAVKASSSEQNPLLILPYWGRSSFLYV